MTDPESLVRCPSCKGEVCGGAEQWCCQACGQQFPVLLGIPLLMRDPRAVIGEWADSLAAFSREMTESARHLLARSVESGLPKLTRSRLLKLADDLPRHEARILSLFDEAQIKPSLSERRRSGGASVLDYYSLIHRDYGWIPAVDEVAPSVGALMEVLPDGYRLGRTLVLGAGTGRLAWQLGHELRSKDEIWALDVNPLPFFVTAKLMRGEAVSLFELPGHPLRSPDASVERTLVAEDPPPSGLKLVFADGLDPPFPDGSFDTILTPWFVDQVPSNAAELLPRLARLLRRGGAWLQHGPLVYDPARTEAAHRYTVDEFLQLVAEAGFRVSRQMYRAELYMASPVSTQARRETVLTFHATFETSGSLPVEPSFLLDPDGRQIIPRVEVPPNFRPPLPILARVLSLADGTRTAREMASVLIETGELADDGTALSVVLGCLRVLVRVVRQSASSRGDA